MVIEKKELTDKGKVALRAALFRASGSMKAFKSFKKVMKSLEQDFYYVDGNADDWNDLIGFIVRRELGPVPVVVCPIRDTCELITEAESIVNTNESNRTTEFFDCVGRSAEVVINDANLAAWTLSAAEEEDRNEGGHG